MIESIIHCLNLHYGISVAALTLLPIGADRDASVYKADTQDKSYFVKLKHGQRYDITPALLALLEEAGIKMIVPPIKTITGDLTQRVDHFTLTVYPFVFGQNGFFRPLTDDQWIAFGAVLRRVHELDVPFSIKKLIRNETYSDRARKFVRSLYSHLDANLEGDPAALKLQTFMKEHPSLILHLVNRAEALSQKIQKQSPEFVLCHSDIHGGNVLIDERGSIFLVDWDAPMMAPKERDLMFIGGGVGNVWNRPHEEQLFYKGYGMIEINREILAYYRYERIVEDIAEYGQALLLTPDGGEERKKMLGQFLDMFEPNGVVDIALKSDVAPIARIISVEKEKKKAIEFRQKHFFDRLNIQDPYAWALDRKDHLHWLLYDRFEVIGYAHVQLWPNDRAALRIIVIDEQKRGQGMGTCLIDHIERELRQRGVLRLQTEASPSAVLFYEKLGYIEMPFDNPDGELTHPDDRAIGKYL